MLKAISTFAALATLTQAFKIPPGMQDGLYTTLHDENGVAHHAYHGPVDTTGLDDHHYAQSAKVRRATPLPSDTDYECHPGFVTALDWASATTGLINACSTLPTYGKGQHAWIQSGAAIAFMCSYTTNYANPCAADEMRAAVTKIQSKCPNYRAGECELRPP